MKQAFKTLAVTAALLTSLGSAYSYNYGPTATYSNLEWAVSWSGAGLTNCTRMLMDATGDLTYSDQLVTYGTITCGSGGYGMTGNIFLASDGSLNVYLSAAGYSIYCPRVSNWYGTCTVYDVDGVQRGTGYIQLL